MYKIMDNEQITVDQVSTMSEEQLQEYLRPLTQNSSNFSFVQNGKEYFVINNASDPVKADEEIIEGIFNWQDMTFADKRDYTRRVLSSLMSYCGVSKIYLHFNSEHSENFGAFQGNSIHLSEKILFIQSTPYLLLETCAHELTHYCQQLTNLRAKKDDIDPKYFPDKQLAYNELSDPNFAQLTYSSNLMEEDSRTSAYYFLMNLKDELRACESSEKSRYLLAELDKYLIEAGTEIIDDLSDRIYLKSHKRSLDRENAALDSWSKEFVAKLALIGETSDTTNFNNFLNKDYNYRDLMKYISIATVEVDQSTHRKLLQTLAKHKRIETVSIVNALGYKNTYDELKQAGEILKDEVGEALFVPIMLKLFNHIEPDKLKELASDLLGDKTAQIGFDAVQKLMDNKIKLLSGSLDIDDECPSSAIEYQSQLLENIYPEALTSGEYSFCNDYISSVSKVIADSDSDNKLLDTLMWRNEIIRETRNLESNKNMALFELKISIDSKPNTYTDKEAVLC